MRKGLFKKEQEQFIAVLLANKIEFRNILLQRLKKPAFKLIISTIDNNLIDRIPDDWQSPLIPIIDAAMESRWETAGEAAASLINEKVDVPGIDEISEQAIINGLIQMILGAIISRAAIEK